MLYSLHVKNLALIEEQEIRFGEGLNILTGETGAGKSVIIGSVNYALGEKADRTLIRDGAEYALLEMIFGVTEPGLLSALREMDIPVEDDGTLIIQRKIYPNRSVCRVSGETVTLSMLRELSPLLINIHGQHDTTALLTDKAPLSFLDAFAGDEARVLSAEMKVRCQMLSECRKAYEDSGMDERTRAKEEDLARYEIAEIEAADYHEGEEDALEDTYRHMRGAEKRTEAIGGALSLIEGTDSRGESAVSAVSEALRLLRSLPRDEEDAEGFAGTLTDAEVLLQDAVRSMRAYLEGDVFDPETFARTEERLNLINRLKDKYGDIGAYLSEKREYLEKLADYDAYREELYGKMTAAQEKALDTAAKLSSCRKKAAKELALRMEKALVDLDFKGVRFEIPLTTDEDKLSESGYDQADFLIATNPGEPLRPLRKIASGGELSRIMLAFRTVMVTEGAVDTMIFDEIDSGVSGRTAWKVASALGALSGTRQVICITHLPQIAAMSDIHFYIEKGEKDVRTVTSIRELNEEESIDELARLLGTDALTDAVRSNAREMREKALQQKAGK